MTHVLKLTIKYYSDKFLIKFKYKMLISLLNYDLIKESFSSIDIYLC